MSWFDDNIDQIKIGLEGEEIIRKYLMNEKIPFMQVDIMFKENDKWYCGEIKTQEIFKSLRPIHGFLVDFCYLPLFRISLLMETKVFNAN